MRIRKIISVIGLLSVLWYFSGCESIQPKTTEALDYTEIVVLHTNDLHFDFNYRETFGEVVGEFRDEYENVFLVDGGDIFTRHEDRWSEEGCYDFYEKRTRFMMESMSELGYDAAVLGNHELDYKKSLTRDSLRLAQFPLLGANVEVETDQFDSPDPYVVFETTDGDTIAVLGLSTGSAEGVSTLSYEDTLEEYLYLSEKHDAFGLLTHIGHRNDKSLARKFDEIDFVVGGHSHTHLNPAEITNDVLIAQTGGHSHQIDPEREQHLGVVRLLFEDGELSEKTGEIFTIVAEGEVHKPRRAAVSSKAEIIRLDEVKVYVQSYLAGEELEVLTSLEIDGDRLGSKTVDLQPGEAVPVAFKLPSSMTGRHEIGVSVEFDKPEDLPYWEKRLDFEAIKKTKSFDLDDGEGQDRWIEITPGIAGGWDTDEFKKFILQK